MAEKIKAVEIDEVPTETAAAPKQRFNFNNLNTLSVVSLATSVTGFGALAGVITGHIALAQIKKSGASGRALAIAGLVVGYATIAFWAFSSLVWVGLALKGFGAGYGMMGWDYMGNGHFGPGMMGNN